MEYGNEISCLAYTKNKLINNIYSSNRFVHTLNSGSRWLYGIDALCLKKAQANGVAKVKQRPKMPNVAGRVNQGYLQRVPLLSK